MQHSSCYIKIFMSWFASLYSPTPPLSLSLFFLLFLCLQPCIVSLSSTPPHSLSLSLYNPCLSVCLSVCVSPSVCPSVCLCVSPSVCPSVSVSVPLSVSVSVSLFVSVCLQPHLVSVFLFTGMWDSYVGPYLCESQLIGSKGMCKMY